MSKLTESDIQARASGQSYDRGRRYYDNGCVLDVTRRGNAVTAAVEGSQYEPYQVEVILKEDGGIARAYCDCPYDWGGDCKHIVAVLLTLVHEPEEVQEKPELEELLVGLNETQLRQLLLNTASREPKIVDIIEKEAGKLAKDGADTAVSPKPPAVDVSATRRAIRAAWRSAGRSGGGYSGGYYDEYDGMEIFGHEIFGDDLAKVEELLDAEDPDTAVELITAVIEEWAEGIEDLDEWVYEYNEEALAQDTHDLAVALAEALLSLDLPPEEREDWLDQIEGWDEYLGGGMDAAVTAVTQWWNYPPLVKAMAGHITNKGAWEEEALWYADDLARARLRILERQGRQEEYINLAEAEGQTLPAIKMKIRVGRIKEATENAQNYLNTPAEILEVAQTLTEMNEQEKALALAQHGLKMPRKEGKTDLAQWLRQQAEEMNRPELALEAAQAAFTSGYTLDDYLEVKRLAGDRWPQIKPKMLESLESAWSTPQVNVYLHENMLREAMQVVDHSPYSGDMERVAAAVKDQYPDWAIQKYKARGEAIMDAGKAKYYDTAVSWLAKARDVYREHGRDAEWQAYLDSVLEKHQRKYKLVPLLRQIR